MEKIVLYSRVSTQDQDYESQFEDLKKWATLNKFEVVGVFGEKVSGYDLNAERKEYDAMKQYVLDNDIKNIGIWEISRLGRSMVKTINEIDFFNKHNVNIHFKKENLSSISDNAANTMLLSILSSMAEMERNTFIERGVRGRMAAVKKGKAIGYSTLPYGYTKDDKGYLKIDDKESKIIRQIYDWIIKGWALNRIARELNSLNIPTRKKIQGITRKLYTGEEVDITWKASVIGRMVKRPIYKGERKYRDVVISIPAIVDKETWDKAQKRFEDNIGYINRTKYEYLFKSMMKCGHCGYSFVTQTNTIDKYSYYLDLGDRDRYKKCRSIGYLKIELVDEVIYKQLFFHKDSMIQVHKDVMSNSNIENKKQQITYYENEIQKLESKRKRILKLYAEEYIEDVELQSNMEEITKNKIEFKNNIELLKNSLQSLQDLSMADTLIEYYYSEEYNIKREFIEKYVNGIFLYRVKNSNLKFEYPLRKNEKVIYAEVFAFGNPEPLRIVFSVYSKNVIVDRNLSYFKEFQYLTRG